MYNWAEWKEDYSIQEVFDEADGGRVSAMQGEGRQEVYRENEAVATSDAASSEAGEGPPGYIGRRRMIE